MHKLANYLNASIIQGVPEVMPNLKLIINTILLNIVDNQRLGILVQHKKSLSLNIHLTGPKPGNQIQVN